MICGKPGNRSVSDAAFHCHHRFHGDIYYLYVDFDPPNYITSKVNAFGFISSTAICVDPAENDSIFKVLTSWPIDLPPESIFEEIVAEGRALADELVARFAEKITNQIETGRIDLEQIENSLVIKAELR